MIQYFDIKKSTIVFYINEILYKSIKDNQPDKKLFDFICSVIIHLDSISGKILNFMVFASVQLTKFFGFFPKTNYSEKNNVFNIVEGTFHNNEPSGDLFLLPHHSLLLSKFIISDLDNYHHIDIDDKTGIQILNALNSYYSIHIINNYEIKSFKIFERIFND